MDDQHNNLERIMRQLESSNPSIHLHKKEIERRWCKLSHTPDHPPYASMIQKAISELNDRGGSSEEAISKFIETEYDDLPIAHASYLSHHLQKLVTKGEVVYTSANCYLLPFEYSDSVHKLKGQKPLRKFRLKDWLRAVKGVQSQQKQPIEEGQEWNEEISEGAEEQRIGLIGENKEPGDAVLIEVEEAQSKMIEDEQYKEAGECDLMQGQQNHQQMELNVQESQVEGNADKEGHQARKNDQVTEIGIQEVHNDLVTEEQCHSEQNSEKPESEARGEQVESADIQIETMAEDINSLEQCPVLCETIEGTAEKQSEEQGSHQVGTSGEVTEKVVQEVQEDVVIEEALLREPRSETPVESNPIRVLESEGREAQAQVADTQIETMEEQQGQCFELNCEEKKLQELKMEVHHQIKDLWDLSNSLMHFNKKKKEDKATAGTQYDNALTKELLKNTLKIGVKLMDIVDMDVLEHNNSEPTMGMKQKNSLENHPQQTKETCLQGSESLLVHDCQTQQHEICGQPEVSKSQPRTILASNSVPTSLMGFEGCQIELPTCKRPAEVEITVLEGLNREQVDELSTDHQQEITSRDVAIPPIFELGQEQQPENLVEGRPTEHELPQQKMQGQKLQEQLPSLSQMLSKAKVTIATSIAEQHVWRKKMPDQQQLRKLRPRGGPRPSEHEPVLANVEADDDFTLSSLQAKLKQKSETSINRRLEVQGSQTEVEISQSTEQAPLNRKRQQKHGHKAVFKISQPTEWQVNHHDQIESQPTTITTVDSASTSQQQTQEQPHSQSESVVVKSTEESLPLGNMQSEQVKPQCQRRGRPPNKVKPDVDPPMTKLSVLNHQHHVQKRTRGRPSKKETNADASMKKSQDFYHPNHEEQQQKRAPGRPSKKRTDADASKEESMFLDQNKHEERAPGRPSKRKTDADASMEESMFLDLHKHEEQQQKRAPGRPSKRKTNADASMEGSLLSDHQNHDEQRQRRDQLRPSKKKRTADASMEGSSKRARGRPAKKQLSSNVDLTAPPRS